MINACIVDQDIKPPKSRCHFPRHAKGLAFLGQIRLEGGGFTTFGSYG